MSERCEAQEGLDTPLLALKLAGTKWEEMWVPSRNSVCRLADSQYGNRNLRPTTAGNWTGLTTWTSLKLGLSQSLQIWAQLTLDFIFVRPWAENIAQPAQTYGNSLHSNRKPVCQSMPYFITKHDNYLFIWAPHYHGLGIYLLTHLIWLTQGQTHYRCMGDVEEIN